MSLPKNIKTCLVVSYGPVPTPQYQTIEGGGMRAWGLAEGLKRNGISVTVAVNNSFPQESSEHEGIKLTNWGTDQRFADLMNTYDAVVVSYCMGSDSVFIADNINDSVQLILDAYVPIYVEVSARESKNIDDEYRAYMADIQRFSHVLKRGDYFLCANEAQRVFYTGVLCSLGILNPRSYRQGRIISAPFGVHDIPATATYNPYLKLGIKKSDFVVMWFGGLYPWFRIEELLDAILKLSSMPDFKFVVVGGKNPFNPNPDFFRQYEKAQTFAQEHALLNHSMYFVDWVDFGERINWFRNADIVVSLNQPGEENGFSWRTRVMDFVWGELAILTNGGDPLSEDLIAEQAAIRLDDLSATAIAEALRSAHDDKKILQAVHKRVLAIKPRYFWPAITKPVAEIIDGGILPYKDEQAYRKQLHLDSSNGALSPASSGRLHKVSRAVKLPRRALSYARRKGYRRSARLAASIAKRQVAGRLLPRTRKYVFISNIINHTGAPMVLMQMLHECAEKYGAKNIHLLAPHITPEQLRQLREMGIKVDKSAGSLGRGILKLQLDLHKNDFVLMNTIAIHDNYREYILDQLSNGHLKHAYWFIHEDKAQIPGINAAFTQKHNLRRLRQLSKDKKLTIVTPSKRTKEEYAELIESPDIHTVPLRVAVPKKYRQPRSTADYRTINFFLSGTPSDGRKGQLIAIAALHDFLTRYRAKNPKLYRNFNLHLLSIGDDYISQQIGWIGTSLLGDRIKILPPAPHHESLEITATCNAVICCSLNETFGLYVAEAMFAGHIVLRNNSAGVDEQLKEGVNGFFIDHTDIHQFADVIETILNKDKNSDEQLQAMGAASQEIISHYAENTYLDKIEVL